MEIAGLTAVVTGATGRLGRAITLGLAAAGMDCVCHYHRNRAAGEALAEQITTMGRKAMAVQADLAQPEAIADLFASAAAVGPVRVLVNSASVFQRCALQDATPAAVQQTLAVNLAAPMLTCREFVRRLDEGPSADRYPTAKIINMADVAATRPWAEYAVYCAAKAGLIGLTRALAKELAPRVTVNAIAPGIVTWPEPMDPDEERRQLARIPVGRFGEPEDIVRSVIFLLENDYITGQVLAVDGGRSI